ncbi:MAG: cytidine deaminase [Alphaproteobacteria bacterium]|nr:cytidine deaminase [Alphaproteobacteria bacterium]
MKTNAELLVRLAKDLIRTRYDKKGHHSVVASVVLTKNGNVYQALNVGTYQPSISTCAEIVAIGIAHTAEPDMMIDTIVAVRDKEPYVVAPCGKCREYIADYGPKAKVLMPAQNKRGWTPTEISKLLPSKYRKRECSCK